MALKSNICGIVHHDAEFEFTARPRCRVLNSHQGRSAYPGFVPEPIIYREKF